MTKLKTNQNPVNVVTELNVLLADYHVFYQKLRNFHWNVMGENFFDLHEKFESMYNDTRVKIDEVAERIITLKYHPVSKLGDYLEISNIQESSPLLTDKEMVEKIVEDQEILIKQLYKINEEANKNNDEGTIDLIGAYIRQTEKSSWMLNAWLKKPDTKMNSVLLRKSETVS
ncbi:MAG: DNA starvation/stationary phase protection protein [Flavobacteriaceae bacterium]|nr:DNA starvation/stationary phase protection protein [Flavobacteriaceae bacterium]|tara:strand:+ start:105115 stop:105630 length:516 start_codon:yes stop_codon:yes gene_type:complete